MYLLQYPLRAGDRSYDEHGAVQHASFKENARRLEMEVPLRLHTFEHNYDPEKDPAGAQQNLHLRSTVVPAQSGLAGGYVRKADNGQRVLVLSRVEGVLQLRPHLKQQVETPRKGKETKAEAGDERPTFIKVEVRKRETERQHEQRINSYAYLAQQEQAEKPVRVACKDDESEYAEKLWRMIEDAPKARADGVPMCTILRQTYLAKMTPGNTLEEQVEADLAAGAAGRAVPAALKGPGAAALALEAPSAAGPSGFTPSVASKRPALASPSKAPSKRQKVAPATQTHSIKGKEPMLAPEEHTDQEMPPAEVLLRLGAVSREAAAILPTAMDEMFTRHSVVNLTDIKRFLQSPQAPRDAAQAAEAHDEHLSSALRKSGKVIQIRECYVQAPAKESQDAVDQLRSLLIEVLQQKESFRKSEVQKLLKDRNAAIDDRTYARIVKEWCISKGNVWKLKPGASGT
eukprot:jgi/Astpho2/829/Aster-00678